MVVVVVGNVVTMLADVQDILTVDRPSFIVSYLVPFFDIINLHLHTMLQRFLCKRGTKGLEPDILWWQRWDRLVD